MSTKSSIAYGNTQDGKYDFHLYNECFDDDHVYLEVDAEVVKIPLAVWEAIRTFPGGSFELVDKSDSDLRKMAEEHVDERIGQVKEARKVKDKKNRKSRLALISLFGCGLYGAATDPRDVQVQRGLKEHKRRRKHQRKILAEAKDIIGKQRKGPYLINFGTGEVKTLGEETCSNT